MSVVPLHLFFDLEVLVRQRLPHFLSLQRNYLLKGVFFLPQHHHFALVVREFFS